MRVLHLPRNIASQTSVTVRALRDIGIDARGIVLNNSVIQESQFLRNFNVPAPRKHPFRGLIKSLYWWSAVIMALRWADVVHWHYRNAALPNDLDLKYAAFLNKARIVEFWGSDIHIPGIDSADNPYRARMYQKYPELAHGAREMSLKTQRRFGKYGFECMCPLGLQQYLQKDIFPTPFTSRGRLMIMDFDAKYPDPGKRLPLIVHAPSRKKRKGTEAVLKSIYQLKSNYDFDFKLVHGVAHSKALEIVRNCDIMVDQFTSGQHGLAALEAMAFGKPTLCYIKPYLITQYPSDLPIVNANEDNLVEVLGNLLDDGHRRHQIGRLSRAYVEKHPDARNFASDLVRIYEDLIRRTHNKKK